MRRQVFGVALALALVLSASLGTAVADAGTTLEVNGPPVQLTSDSNYYLGSFSPDGTRIAYIRGGLILTANADGSNPTQVYAAGSRPKWGPAIAGYPDGLIALAGTGITVIEPDGTLVKIIDTSHVYPSTGGTITGTHSVDWSPDGTKLAFADAAGTMGIWAIGFDGAGLVQITDYSLPAYAPAWSPDGTEIASAYGLSSDMHVGIHKADGTGWVRSVGVGGSSGGDYPDWGANGKIAYHDGNKALHVVNGDGSDDSVAFAGPAVMVAWSPDGKRIAYLDAFGGNIATRSCPHGTIQDAINAASAGDTVNVAAGTYDENVTIGKALSLRGADKVTTIIQSQLAETNGDKVVIIDADGVSVSGFTLSGHTATETKAGSTSWPLYADGFSDLEASNNIFTFYSQGGIRFLNGSNLVIEGNDFRRETRSVWYDPAGAEPGSYVDRTRGGMGPELWSCSDAAIRSNVIETVAVGVFVEGCDGVSIKGNTVSAPDTTAPSDVGIHIQSGSNITVTGNTVSRFTAGEKSSYTSGMDGAAISIMGGSTDIAVTWNTLLGNTLGVLVRGAAEGSGIGITHNDFIGNTAFGVLNCGAWTGKTQTYTPAGASVDGTYNYWGNPDGPGAAASGEYPQGDAVSDDVDYASWIGAQTEEVASATLGNGQTVQLPGDVPDEPAVAATLSGSGTADVTLASYAANPGQDAGTLIGAGSTFYDILVTDLTDVDATLTLTVTAGAAGEVLRYWDGSAWSTVIGNDGSIPQTAADGTLTVVFGPNSHPRLVELTGTAIVTSEPEALAVQFASGPATVGQAITAEVVAKSTNLYGVQVALAFDPTKLAVASLALGGDLLAQDIGENTYDNTAGTISFAFSQQSPTPAQVGDDILLATITFTPLAATLPVTTVVGISAATFGDPDGMALGVYPDTVGYVDTDASIAIQNAASLSSTVTLQGRTVHAGVLVGLLQGGAPVRQANTPASGGFLWADILPGDGYSAAASFAGYLRAEAAPRTLAPGANSLPPVKLLGGDATGDQTISILDVSFIAARFNGSNPQADINGDGTVNILDLVLAAVNFEKTGPQAWN